MNKHRLTFDNGKFISPNDPKPQARTWYPILAIGGQAEFLDNGLFIATRSVNGRIIQDYVLTVDDYEKHLARRVPWE